MNGYYIAAKFLHMVVEKILQNCVTSFRDYHNLFQAELYVPPSIQDKSFRSNRKWSERSVVVETFIIFIKNKNG